MDNIGDLFKILKEKRNKGYDPRVTGLAEVHNQGKSTILYKSKGSGSGQILDGVTYVEVPGLVANAPLAIEGQRSDKQYFVKEINPNKIGSLLVYEPADVASQKLVDKIQTAINSALEIYRSMSPDNQVESVRRGLLRDGLNNNGVPTDTTPLPNVFYFNDYLFEGTGLELLDKLCEKVSNIGSSDSKEQPKLLASSFPLTNRQLKLIKEYKISKAQEKRKTLKARIENENKEKESRLMAEQAEDRERKAQEEARQRSDKQRQKREEFEAAENRRREAEEAKKKQDEALVDPQTLNSLEELNQAFIAGKINRQQRLARINELSEMVAKKGLDKFAEKIKKLDLSESFLEYIKYFGYGPTEEGKLRKHVSSYIYSELSEPFEQSIYEKLQKTGLLQKIEEKKKIVESISKYVLGSQDNMWEVVEKKVHIDFIGSIFLSSSTEDFPKYVAQDGSLNTSLRSYMHKNVYHKLGVMYKKFLESTLLNKKIKQMQKELPQVYEQAVSILTSQGVLTKGITRKQIKQALETSFAQSEVFRGEDVTSELKKDDLLTGTIDGVFYNGQNNIKKGELYDNISNLILKNLEINYSKSLQRSINFDSYISDFAKGNTDNIEKSKKAIQEEDMEKFVDLFIAGPISSLRAGEYLNTSKRIIQLEGQLFDIGTLTEPNNEEAARMAGFVYAMFTDVKKQL